MITTVAIFLSVLGLFLGLMTLIAPSPVGFLPFLLGVASFILMLKR